MFIQRLINQGNAPLLERMMKFTSARHGAIADNVANIDVPNHRQKDLSLPAFQKTLRERVDQRRDAPVGTVGFDDIDAELKDSNGGLFFHDRQNRSMEQLMADLSSNGMKHNMYTELLRKSYESLHTVLKDRIA